MTRRVRSASLRRRVVAASTGLAALVLVPSIASTGETEAAWTNSEYARTSVVAASLPNLTMTRCDRQPNNVALFTYSVGPQTLAPTGFSYVVRNAAGTSVGSGTFPVGTTQFALPVGALALLQRYTVTVAATNGGWSSATPAVGHIDITLGLLAWSCGPGA